MIQERRSVEPNGTTRWRNILDGLAQLPTILLNREPSPPQFRVGDARTAYDILQMDAEYQAAHLAFCRRRALRQSIFEKALFGTLMAIAITSVVTSITPAPEITDKSFYLPVPSSLESAHNSHPISVNQEVTPTALDLTTVPTPSPFRTATR